MEEDPGSDAWTTVDRKTAKKKGKESRAEPDSAGGGWSQVTKDRRRKESAVGRSDQSDRRGDRRGDRGKPPMHGGSAQRNTLPRKPSQKDGAAGWSSNRSSPSPAPSRNLQTPVPEGRNRSVPESNSAKQAPEDVPRKSSWACLVGNKGSEGPETTDNVEEKSELERKPAAEAQTLENPQDCHEIVEKIDNQEMLSKSDNDSSLSKSSGCLEQSHPSIQNLNEVPSNERSSVESKPVESESFSAINHKETNQTQKDDEDAVLVPASQRKTNDITPSEASPHCESAAVKPEEVSSPPRENLGIVMSIDTKKENSDVQTTSLEFSEQTITKQDLDSNGNKVQLDKNKNETSAVKTEISMEEIVGKISPETRQYDRDLLLQLKKHPLSLQKPEKLPELEIVLNSPMRVSTSAPTLGEMPSQYVHTFGGRMAMPKKRDSQRKESKKIISLSREPVRLHKAENAWMPGNKSNEDKVSELDALSKKVRAILNKLTPQKFDALVVQFKELTIDSEEKLVQCMELVFEKALDESAFSEGYAKMCKELSLKNVKDHPVDFKSLLLKRCQVEFEKDYMSEDQRKKYAEDIASASTEDDKKRIKEEFEMLESKLRRRSLGNIKFIGELYKLQILQGKILHHIIQRLLTSTDEESLECLCRLLYTCGGMLEAQVSTIPEEHRHNYDFDNYFAKIREIIDSKKTTSRVRFLLQDVIDLRNNKWVSRRVEAGPKKIEQIHKEAKLEALKIQLADQKPDPPIGRRSEERSRRKTEYRPKQANQETLWSNVPNRAAKMSDVVDPERLRMIKKVDADSLIFGPSMGRGFSSTGFGSSMGKPAETVRSVNRFQMLEDTEVGDNQPMYSGRASEPVRSSYEMGARTSSPSLRNPIAASSRDVSTIQTRSTLQGKPDADIDQLHTKSVTLIEEYLNNCDFEETLSSVCELYHTKSIEILVEETFNLGMEKKLKRDRDSCGRMLSLLLDSQVISWANLTAGLGVLLEIASDIIVDFPKFWELTADMLAVVLIKQDIFGPVVETCCSLLENDQQRRNFILAILREVRLNDLEKFTKFTSNDKELLEKLLLQNLQTLLCSERLTDDKPDIADKTETLVNGSLQEDLYKKLAGVFSMRQAGNDEMSSVDDILCDKVMDKETVRTVVTAVIESAIDGIGGPSVNCTLNVDTLKGRIPILKKYLDANKDKEVYSLYAIQNLVNRLEHPNKLLHSILELLYDNECISEEGLFDWEKSDDPEEQEGKGVALKSCNQLFQWLRTAEEEDDQAV